MTFNFPVLNDNQIAEARGILKPGIYRFKCINAKEDISKNGNSMIVLYLKVFDQTNRPHSITDYLVSTEKMSYKIKHFFNSIGTPEKYNSGNATGIDFFNKDGWVKTGIEMSTDGFQNPKIIDYVLKDETQIPKTNHNQFSSKLSNDDFKSNDDVPF